MAKTIKVAGMIFFVLVVSCLLLVGGITTTKVTDYNSNNLLSANDITASNNEQVAADIVYDYELSGTCAQMAVTWNEAVEKSIAENKNINVKLMNDWTAETHSSMVTAFSSTNTNGFNYGRISVRNNAIMTLDLNGHTINRGLSDQANYVNNGHVIVVYNATLTIMDSSYNEEVALQTYENNPQNLKNLPYGKITGGNSIGGANGAGIRLDQNGILYFKSGIVYGNSANGSGGGIGCVNDNNGHEIYIEGGIITDNRAIAAGGGVYAAPGAIISVKNAIIANNSVSATTSQGGGMYLYNCKSTINLENLKVAYNISVVNGGGISFYGINLPTIKMNNCEIVNNKTTANNGFGGGVYIHQNAPQATINNCKINDNVSSGSGGGLAGATNTNLIISESEFLNNTAVNGGGILASDDSKVKITNTTFENNEAVTGYGGGISTQNSTIVTLTNVTITNNNAALYAGGFVAHSSSHVTMSQCTVSNNHANSGAAGGVHVSSYNMQEILDCTIENNTAATNGGGILCNTGAHCNIRNSHILNNVAAAGGGIYIVTHSMVNFNNTDIDGNTATSETLGGGGLYLSSNGALNLASDVVVRNNTAALMGGGLFLNGVDVKLAGAKIYDNKLQDNLNSDIYLIVNKRLKITEKVVCEDGKKIYVQLPSGYSKVTPFTFGYSQYGNSAVDPSSIFACADSNKVAVLKDGEVIFDDVDKSIYDYIYLEDGVRKSYRANDKLQGYNDSTLNGGRLVLGNIMPNTSIKTFLENTKFDTTKVTLYDNNGNKVFENNTAVNVQDYDNKYGKPVGTGWRVEYNGIDIYLSVLGDVTGDGDINAMDVAYLRSIANGEVDITTLTTEKRLAALIDNRGIITSADAEILNAVISYKTQIDKYFN